MIKLSLAYQIAKFYLQKLSSTYSDLADKVPSSLQEMFST